MIQKSWLYKPELNTTAGIFTLSIGPIHSELNNTSFQAVMGVGGKDGRIRYIESKKAVVIVESMTQKAILLIRVRMTVCYLGPVNMGGFTNVRV